MASNIFYLAAVVAAHRNGTVAGRTRLQKTIKLLQRLGLPTDYYYSIHFYGPYSEGLQADIGQLTQLKLASEDEVELYPDYKQKVIRLEPRILPLLPSIDDLKGAISVMESTPSVVLELAATYDAFREQGASHGLAIERVRLKKGDKCGRGNVDAATTLLRKLNLPSADARNTRN